MNQMLKPSDTKEKLYKIYRDVKCINCNNIGAVQSYGTVNEPSGKISHTIGFGGTIPLLCLNCGNTGLINFNGLEGYKRAFIKINTKNEMET